MLQQTPVSRVIPAWTQWMDRWPTVEALASASLSDVLVQWNRLGYPRRAKNLHRTAKIITVDYGGVVPRVLSDLLSLPGVGDYTARAILCFAFGEPHPVVDTNVKRVVARAFDGEAGAGHWSIKQGLERVDAAVDHPINDADYCLTQRALMELGALVCKAANPDCDECPLRDMCRWRVAGYPVEQRVLPRTQARYEGSDRQARGVVLGFLRENPGAYPESQLRQLWPAPAQYRRALDSLVSDGLVDEIPGHEEPHFRLSGSEPDRGE